MLVSYAVNLRLLEPKWLCNLLGEFFIHSKEILQQSNELEFSSYRF